MSYQFEKIRELGKGSFGIVYEVRDKNEGENKDDKDKERKLAIKVINTGEDTGKIDQALEEIRSHFKFCHRNIVEYFGCDLISEQDNKIIELPYRAFGYKAFVIIMELCESTLQEQLEGRYIIQPSVSNSTFLDILYGVSYLHDSGFIHRDLKTENILVKYENGKCVFKIGDFGLGKYVDVRSWAKASAPRGTPFYRAPEQIGGETITTKVDIYSLGIILAELYTLKPLREWDLFQRLEKPPYSEDSSEDEMDWQINIIMKRMMDSKAIDRYRSYKLSKLEKKYELWSWMRTLFDRNVLKLPDNILQLVSQMTNDSPEERQSCKELVSYFEYILGIVSN